MQEVATISDQEAASFGIDETSDESESEEDATSADLQGIDDSTQPDAGNLDLYRAMELEEEARCGLAAKSVDDELAPMREEMERRGALDESDPGA